MTEIKDVSTYHYKDGALLLKSKSYKGFLKGILLIILAICVINPSIGYAPGIKHAKFQEEPYQYVVEKVMSLNPKIAKDEAIEIVKASYKWAKEFNKSPSLILGVITQESNFNKFAISDAGAFGLMQVLPKWHTDKIKEAIKVTGSPELFSIDTNIYLGTKILDQCMRKYSSVNSALLCYNGSVGTDSQYANSVLSNKRKFDPYI